MCFGFMWYYMGFYVSSIYIDVSWVFVCRKEKFIFKIYVYFYENKLFISLECKGLL